MEYKKYIYLIISVFFINLCVAQDKSDINKLRVTIEDKGVQDTVKLKAIKKLVISYYMSNDMDSSYYYLDLQYQFSKDKGLKKGEANALFMKAYFKTTVYEYDKAIELYKQSLAVYQSINYKEGISPCYNNIGLSYRKKGDYTRAIDYYYKSAKIDLEIGNKKGYSSVYINVGAIYMELGEHDSAKESFTIALNEFIILKDSTSQLTSLNNLGAACVDAGDVEEAYNYLVKCLELSKRLNDKDSYANALYNMGFVYKFRREYKKSILFYDSSLMMKKELGKDVELFTALHDIGLGNVYADLKDYKKASKYGTKALKISKEEELLDETKDAAMLLYQSYKELNITGKAFEMYELFILLRDSVDSEENRKAIIRQEYKYEYEKQALTDSLNHSRMQQVKDIKIEKQSAELRTRYIEKVALVFGLALVIFFALYIISRYRNRQHLLKHQIEIEVHKSREIKKDLEQKEGELELKLQMITEKVAVIENLKGQLTNNSNNEEYINKIINSLEQNYVSDKHWDNIIQLFSTIHEDFIPNLEAKSSNITRNDIRLSLLMKLGYSNSGMAETLNISVEGIKKAKQRLKKKIA